VDGAEPSDCLSLFVTGAILMASSNLSVHPCVTAHVAKHTEAAPTALKRADKRFFSSMAVEVDLETARSGEPLAAIVTLVL